MPLFLLKIKADLENIAEMKPIEDCLWKFDIASSTGGDERKGITVSTGDVVELAGSKGEANFAIKWNKDDPGQAHIKIVPVKKVDGSYKAENSGSFVTILGLECRGLVLTRWIPGADFTVTTSGGTVFEEVDLSELEWTEYDEEHDASVSIMALESRIETG